jgi:hypothetical protein
LVRPLLGKIFGLEGEVIRFAKSMVLVSLRVFKPEEAQGKNITISGWETFDKHPDLIHFEGYLTDTNDAYLERKRG